MDSSCTRPATTRPHAGSRTSVSTLGLAFLVAVVVSMFLAGVASAAAWNTLYVSAGGRDSRNCRAPARACATIAYALSQASRRRSRAGRSRHVSRVREPGRWRERVRPGSVGPQAVLEPGLGGSAANTIIDAAGEANGILDQAGNTTVSGFTVEHAQLEGILVEPPPSSWPASATAVTDTLVVGNMIANTPTESGRRRKSTRRGSGGKRSSTTARTCSPSESGRMTGGSRRERPMRSRRLARYARRRTST